MLRRQLGGYTPYVRIIDQRNPENIPREQLVFVPHRDGIHWHDRTSDLWLVGLASQTVKLDITLCYGPLLCGYQIIDLHLRTIKARKTYQRLTEQVRWELTL